MAMTARLFLSIALAGLWSAPALAADAPRSFTSVSRQLPFGDRPFQGEGADPLNNNCLTCHSADMVLVQPHLSAAAWQGEVEKMRSAYKAPVSDEDVKPIVDYLVRIRGAG
jgi:cytochrome c5